MADTPVTGLSTAAQDLIADKGSVDAVVEDAASKTTGATATANTSTASASASAGETSQTPKTEQLARAIKDPINKIKGCGILVVLFACCVIVLATIFMQYRQGSIDALQRQEIYESIQILQHNQDSLEAICNKMILQLDYVEETATSIEQTVEESAATVESVEETVRENAP